MGYGLNPVIANQELDALLSGVAFSSPAGDYVQLHVGDPGIAGTNNISSVTARQAVSWNPASGGIKTLSGTPTWGTWGGAASEILQGLSFWSAVTGGIFIFSVQLASPITVQTGNTLNLPTLSYTRGPVAS